MHADSWNPIIIVKAHLIYNQSKKICKKSYHLFHILLTKVWQTFNKYTKSEIYINIQNKINMKISVIIFYSIQTPVKSRKKYHI